MGWIRRAVVWVTGEAYGPPDRYARAIRVEPYIGERGAPNVTVSRRRLRDLLRQAFDAGVDWQVEREAEAAAVARPTFPPRRVARGLLRVRVVLASAAGLRVAWEATRRSHWDCFPPPRDSFLQVMCIGDGSVGVLVIGTVWAVCAALALWLCQLVILWVWRGFREP
jgi:hypothetical protein